MNKINTFDYLSKFERIHVRITDDLFCKIKKILRDDYKSIRKYNDKYLRINHKTLEFEFRRNIYHPFYRLLDITKSLNVFQTELYSNILGFYHWVLIGYNLCKYLEN